MHFVNTQFISVHFCFLTTRKQPLLQHFVIYQVQVEQNI